MNATTTSFKYSLDKSSKKIKCTSCGQLRAVRYKDYETGEFLPDYVQRCDRENSCGHHYTPKQYFIDIGQQRQPLIEITHTPTDKPQEFIPIEFVSKSVKHFDKNNLYHFLKTLFGEAVASHLAKKYLIGTAAYWRGATCYWQINADGQACQCKIILYNPITGKRVKEGAIVERLDRQTRKYMSEVAEGQCSKVYGKYLSEATKELSLEQTWFGHHLLKEYPDKEVCVVESEKTALICSVYLPQFVWLATGGARGGCKWREYKVYKALKGRSVTLYPDYGWADKKKGITCYSDWCERVERIKDVMPVKKLRVSDVLEKRLNQMERQDQDLADLLIKRDNQTAHALTEDEYPVAWDYQSE